MKTDGNYKQTLLVLISYFAINIAWLQVAQAQDSTQRVAIISATDTAALNRLSLDLLNISIQQKAEAVKWATDHGYPVKGMTPDSGGYELQKIENGVPLYYITLHTT